MTTPAPDSVADLWPRIAGILLHPTSLPGGDLGEDAHRFIDFLAAAGQRAWQIMPLGPPGPGDSPYASRSAFAGNPGLISLDRLAGEGLIDASRLPPPKGTESRIDFRADAEAREPLLREAFAAFERQGRRRELDEFAASAPWLRGYSIYAALRAQTNEPWWKWGPELRDAARVCESPPSEVAEEVAYQQFLQLQFQRQWADVRIHARDSGVRLIGDMPIFVDLDSHDVWAHQELFKLNQNGEPLRLAGVPPDAFSATGQLWGNPVYDWDSNRRDGYRWWVERMRRTFELVDAVRIDHFRGFESAWEIPAGEPTAEHGEWVKGPGAELFREVQAQLGPKPILVEDLGTITPAVHELRQALQYPGMAVLHFAFGDEHDTFKNPHLPHEHRTLEVVYTGTHDNDTTGGWWSNLPEAQRDVVRRYLGRDVLDPVDDMIRLLYSSPACTAIIPMQDVLKLGSEGRMNVPGQAEGNWNWRFTWDQLPPERVTWLRELAGTYDRL